MRRINNLTNMILNVDSYKTSHWKQLPEGTTHMFAYISSRGGMFDELVNFGFSMFAQEYLNTPITLADITEAEYICEKHGIPFNKEGWMAILDDHDGFLPIRIMGPQEGMVIPAKLPIYGVMNTDSRFPWLVTYIETALLRAIWYPTTVATVSFQCRKIIKRYLEETADNWDGLPFKLHDFGARGVSSFESAGIGGLAHLATGAMGTDTMTALLYAEEYYNPHRKEDIAGYSIPAGEHSTYTSWGKDNELGAYRNMLQQYGKPGAIFAAVSDSYNIYNAVEKLWGEELRQEVIDSGATVVIRPDSGNPLEVAPALLKILDEKFGSVINSKGYKVLNNVRMIWGDGINVNTIGEILEAVKAAGFSADNMAFGMGGALLQGINRDTQRFAMKASAVKINGKWRPISKDPITDPGKKSLEGLLMLTRSQNGKFGMYATLDEEMYLESVNEDWHIWGTLWEEGELMYWPSLTEVREEVAKFL